MRNLIIIIISLTLKVHHWILWSFYLQPCLVRRKFIIVNIFGTWMGKDFKVRSQSWGGNQYTGGKNQFALKMSKKDNVGRKCFGYL